MKITEVRLPTLKQNGHIIIQANMNINQFQSIAESCGFVGGGKDWMETSNIRNHYTIFLSKTNPINNLKTLCDKVTFYERNAERIEWIEQTTQIIEDLNMYKES